MRGICARVRPEMKRTFPWLAAQQHNMIGHRRTDARADERTLRTLGGRLGQRADRRTRRRTPTRRQLESVRVLEAGVFQAALALQRCCCLCCFMRMARRQTAPHRTHKRSFRAAEIHTEPALPVGFGGV